MLHISGIYQEETTGKEVSWTVHNTGKGLFYFVFVGLLAGRELAFATVTQKYKFKTVFPLVGKDFFKMMIGLALSVVIVLMIHGFTGFANM